METREFDNGRASAAFYVRCLTDGVARAFVQVLILRDGRYLSFENDDSDVYRVSFVGVNQRGDLQLDPANVVHVVMPGSVRGANYRDRMRDVATLAIAERAQAGGSDALSVIVATHNLDLTEGLVHYLVGAIELSKLIGTTAQQHIVVRNDLDELAAIPLSEQIWPSRAVQVDAQ